MPPGATRRSGMGIEEEPGMSQQDDVAAQLAGQRDRDRPNDEYERTGSVQTVSSAADEADGDGDVQDGYSEGNGALDDEVDEVDFDDDAADGDDGPDDEAVPGEGAEQEEPGGPRGRSVADLE